jgi:hypothetical protein
VFSSATGAIEEARDEAFDTDEGLESRCIRHCHCGGTNEAAGCEVDRLCNGLRSSFRVVVGRKVDEYRKKGDQPWVKKIQAPETTISFRKRSLVGMRSSSFAGVPSPEVSSSSSDKDKGRIGVRSDVVGAA